MLLTTECIITNVPFDQDSAGDGGMDPMAGMGGGMDPMGGMGGMGF
jgi:hypothetical protein